MAQRASDEGPLSLLGPHLMWHCFESPTLALPHYGSVLAQERKFLILT